MAEGGELEQLVSEQIEAVDRRVKGGGNAFAEDSVNVREAARQLDRIRAELGLGELIRSMTPPTGKPQFLLLFDTEEHGPAVLKVYGTVHPVEAASQRLWKRNGVATVEIYASGDAPTSWLLMELVDGETPTQEDVDTDEGLRACTRGIAEIMARAHECGDPHLPGTGPLVVDTMRRLHVVTGSLDQHGYPVPVGWAEPARRLLEQGTPILLHGDLAGVNVMRRRDGEYCVLDASGLTGAAEFDAARWCARTGELRAEIALDEWLSVEPSLDPDFARALLGLELLMEAGVNELVKDEFGFSSHERDELTFGFLAASERLLSS